MCKVHKADVLCISTLSFSAEIAAAQCSLSARTSHEKRHHCETNLVALRKKVDATALFVKTMYVVFKNNADVYKNNAVASTFLAELNDFLLCLSDFLLGFWRGGGWIIWLKTKNLRQITMGSGQRALANAEWQFDAESEVKQSAEALCAYFRLHSKTPQLKSSGCTISSFMAVVLTGVKLTMLAAPFTVPYLVGFCTSVHWPASFL